MQRRWQVHEVRLHAWARSADRYEDGQMYLRSPTLANGIKGVNAWISIDQVQKYMRDRTVPTADGAQIAPMMPWHMQSESYWGSKPWSPPVPPHFQQACAIGALVDVCVIKLLQV